MLRTRVLTAAVLAPLVVAVALLGEPSVSIVVALIVFLGFVELIAMLDAGGFEPPQIIGLASGVAVGAAGLVAVNRASVGGLLAEVLQTTQPLGLVLAVYVAALLLIALVGFTRPDPRMGFITWSITSFGIAYLGILLPFIAMVAHLGPSGGSSATLVGPLGLRSGVAWTLLLLGVVWGYDTGAYLIGRWLGRHRLIEHISPAKTLEGLVGGIALATLAATAGTALVGLPGWHGLVVGPLVGLGGQAGDLAMSLLKRAAGRKESGFLIPGHGGILDRVDSFLFAAPLLAAYAIFATGFTP